jgi:hypothetical protein
LEASQWLLLVVLLCQIWFLLTRLFIFIFFPDAWLPIYLSVLDFLLLLVAAYLTILIYGRYKRLVQNAGEMQTQLEVLHKHLSRLMNKDYSAALDPGLYKSPAFLALQALRNQLIKQKQEENRKKWIQKHLQFFKQELDGYTPPPTNGLSLFARRVLSLVCPALYIEQGLFYALPSLVAQEMKVFGKYANSEISDFSPTPVQNAGLLKKVITEKKYLLLQELPPGFLKTKSGLGQALPTHLLLMPILLEDQALAALELAAFIEFDSAKIKLLEKFCELLAPKLLRILYLQNPPPFLESITPL